MMLSLLYYEVVVMLVAASRWADEGSYATHSYPIGLPFRGATLSVIAILGISYVVIFIVLMATYSCWKQS